MVARCLFEQSGTFKNEFKKLGIEAYDYDIQNEFGETDYQIDLFAEIRGGTKKSLVFSTTSQKMISYLPFSHVLDLRHESLFGLEGRHNNKRNGLLSKN